MSDGFSNISLNALKTLQTVFRLGSVSGAAAALDVQQPSVSYTLDRLRGALDDPLFLRRGRGIAPTDRCRELMPVVDRLLAEADRLRQVDFDPATSTLTMNIVVSGFVFGILIPGLLRTIRAEAPNLTLRVDIGQGSAAPVLLNGTADVALSIEDLNVPGIHADRGFLDDVGVCVMDANNPLANRQLSLDDLRMGRFIFNNPTPNFAAPFVKAAAAAGVDIQPAAIVGDIGFTPMLVVGTDMLGGIPSRMAAQYAPALATARWPFDLTPTWHMYWANTAHRSRPNMWLREKILEEAARLGPPVGV